MFVRVVKGDTLANVIVAANEFTAPNQGSPSRVMSLQGQLGISDTIGDLDQIAEVPQALFILLATTVDRNPQSLGCTQKRARSSSSRTASSSARR